MNNARRSAILSRYTNLAETRLQRKSRKRETGKKAKRESGHEATSPQELSFKAPPRFIASLALSFVTLARPKNIRIFHALFLATTALTRRILFPSFQCPSLARGQKFDCFKSACFWFADSWLLAQKTSSFLFLYFFFPFLSRNGKIKRCM